MSGLELNFDGLCAPNPGGVTTYGFLVRSGAGRLAYGYGLAARKGSPEATNNVAEFTGLIRGLERLVAQSLTSLPLVVRGDSKVVIEARLKDPKLVALREQVDRLMAKFADARIEHVPRAQNWEADALTQIAREERRDVTRVLDPEELKRLRNGELPPAPAGKRMSGELTLAGVQGGGGAVLREGDTTLITRGYALAGAGPNAAVYLALGHALRSLRKMNAHWDLTVLTDVAFIERQLAGTAPVGPDLYEAYVGALRDARGIATVGARRAPVGDDLALAKRLAREAAKSRRHVEDEI